MQKFETPAPIAAVLAVPAGRVQIIAADRSDTVVEIRPMDASKSRDVKAADRATVACADGVLRVEVPVKNQYLASGAVEVTVQLPAGSHVEVKAAGTEFRAVGRLGDVAFDGAYHRIRIDEAASLRLTAIDGDVEVGRLGGSSEISTARGDIRIAEALGGKLVLGTQSGDISVVAAAGVSASLDAATACGRVGNDLRNDGATELAIQATASQGDITARSL
ncbi:DUF4097 family beta strand repeat-containing protein [Streptomyces sp. t39]|uniref:DUF4097 family beta strand repeat-containing protein n=1 Tax=Streptomyces sp. t39 TaxID=1828156 RepID=UPI0011CECDCF|nr:DUF4097 family beta strand repeat-containing protein [Streptomyces sp. t39]TXS57342.1 hypothetical protein EAO77_15635 [Streptomyces sp. t39]